MAGKAVDTTKPAKKRRKPRPPKNDEGRMAVMDHLRELRRRVIFALVFVLLGAVAGYFLYPYTLEFLRRPYCGVPKQYIFLDNKGGCALIYHGALEGFTTRLKVSIISGAVFSGPLWLYQIWAFITPGLRKNERKYTIYFIITSTILFAAGMTLAYVVLAKGMKFLLEASGDGTLAQLTVGDYISFVTLMLVAFGAAFEVPLLVVMANLAGVLKGRWLVKSQRVAIFLIFLFAAVATPTTDPFTMCAMAIPMVALFEGAVLFAVLNDKRKARRKAEERAEEHYEDDVPSQIDPIPQRLDSRAQSEVESGVGSGAWSDST